LILDRRHKRRYSGKRGGGVSGSSLVSPNPGGGGTIIRYTLDGKILVGGVSTKKTVPANYLKNSPGKGRKERKKSAKTKKTLECRRVEQERTGPGPRYTNEVPQKPRKGSKLCEKKGGGGR